MLRELAARGAGELYLLTDAAFAGADTLATARTLCAAVQKTGPYDLIVCGRRAADGETGQVGPALAALLGWPIVTNAVEITVQDGALCAVRLLETGRETLSLPLPCVATLCEWSAPLRLPTLAGLRRAKDAPVTTLSRAELGIPAARCGLAGSPTRVKSVSARPSGLKNPVVAPDAAAFAEAFLLKWGEGRA